MTVVAAAWSIYPVLRLQYQHERERATVEAELTGLKERNVELREQIDLLKTPEGVEELARENLGLVKPGEQPYVVTGGTLGATEPQPSEDETAPPLWREALDSIFGLR